MKYICRPISITNMTDIFRFKFSDGFSFALSDFSTIHKYDSREDFKEAWKIWVEDNNEIIERETNRLKDINYDGDINDKMYKSARFYHRKKSNDKKEAKERNTYIKVSGEILKLIDSHIGTNKCKPADGWANFKEIHKDAIEEELLKLSKQFEIQIKDLENKLKKTYKNRYFINANKNKESV